MAMRWYVIKAVSGREDRAKENYRTACVPTSLKSMSKNC